MAVALVNGSKNDRSFIVFQRAAPSRGARPPVGPSRGAIHLGLSNKLGVALLATYCNRVDASARTAAMTI